ncbi:MAG TPA: mechanosensitive ion channel family protein [Acetobacteraceae bacterium]|jgi:MscS family membrane protein|nr:mechanosensitive ion channel family protein [Acetobacteraceae bacterium]
MACNPAVRLANCLRFAVLVGLLFGFCHAARAADPNPLSPLDTSSPRATLQGFIETVDGIYLGMADVLEAYANSDELYLSSGLRKKQIATLQHAPKALRAVDTSNVSPVLMETIPIERLLQLKEILDRIELPARTDIPDAEAMARLGLKRWRLPGTEIDFVLVKDGPRAGEYLVSAETLDRLPEFYRKVANLPYKPGPAQQLNAVFRTLSSGNTDTIYDAFLSSPVGMAGLVPPRWLLSLPGWAKVPLAGVTAWQWLGLSVGLLVGALFIYASHRLARRLAVRGEDDPSPQWRAVPVPLAIILVAAFLVPLLCTLLHIGGITRVVIAITETMAFYLGAAWLAIVGLIILGDAVVASEHLKRSSLDSQLIRLGVRLVGIVLAILFLIRGADELGFPAYSVLAGLGVGGLAVALAARDSLANLLGSLLIMFEKPFRIGHYIRVGGSEGTVEDVGFRSTRIRTQDNSLISIPNNAVVNTTVENLSLRAMRRQRFFLQVTYDTSREKLEALVAGVRRLIVDHSLTNKTNFQVRFNNFSESSLDILVMFYFDVQDYSVEIREREAILLRTMDLMNEIGVEFAFPTRTLQIEAAPPVARAMNATVSPVPIS